jgi:hypothetical protein
MQYGGIGISNVLCDLKTIIKNSSTLNNSQMSMLKMLMRNLIFVTYFKSISQDKNVNLSKVLVRHFL